MSCRFEIQIRRTVWGEGFFHCAVICGVYGYLHMWKHGGVSDLCTNCKVKISGTPHLVRRELKAQEFCDIAGQLIRTEDYEELKRRGYELRVGGIKEIKKGGQP